MPTNYSGNPSNITPNLTRGVTNCQSGLGGDVQITTSTSHNFATYDLVTVSGVVGTTEANTTASITVLDATNFLLVGVAFVNAYVSGGSVVDLSITPYFQAPANGEAATVESILSSVQCLADRTQYLQLQSRPIAVTTATADETGVVPYGASRALVVIMGGGGGGGGGEGGTNSAGQRAGGGGAGGGAREYMTTIPVTAGAAWSIGIGLGGAGGLGSAETVDGLPGADGGDTGLSVDTYNILAYGAQGGQGGNRAAGVAAAGFNTRLSPKPLTAVVTYEGFGGAGGYDGSVAADGNLAQGASVNSSGGSSGATNAPNFGGAGGGGGGAASSPRGGIPGNGGNGGFAGSAGGSPGGNGTTGSAASANSGCGGGGGGAGGSGTTGGHGGTGGAGGSGYALVYWLR